jgi:acyl dehydratase
MVVYQRLSELKPLVGTEFAVSDWFCISQSQIDQFAEATGDKQWIHVDVERAAAGPFGSTVVHGFLLLSLLPRLFDDAFEVKGTRLRINYGLNRVRFVSPVPAGSRLRARMKLLSYTELPDCGAQLVVEVTIERQGEDRPACVIEAISRRYTEPTSRV